MKEELCKNCGRPVNKPREDMPKLGLRGIGQSIYFRILGGNFESMELCNFCYSVMSAFRYSLSKEDREHYERPTNQPKEILICKPLKKLLFILLKPILYAMAFLAHGVIQVSCWLFESPPKEKKQ